MKVLFPQFYWAPISFFSEFLKDEYEIIFENFEHFPKQTFRNRANIYGANGKLSLIVPIKHTGARMMKDIIISYAENWQKLHWKSLKTAYQSSPYFEFYEDLLEEVYRDQPKFLVDLNLKTLETVQKILKTQQAFTFTSKFIKTPTEKDFRAFFSAKKEPDFEMEQYYQVFSDKMGFIKNLSILDLICNKGPESLTYIKNL